MIDHLENNCISWGVRWPRRVNKPWETKRALGLLGDQRVQERLLHRGSTRPRGTTHAIDTVRCQMRTVKRKEHFLKEGLKELDTGAIVVA